MPEEASPTAMSRRAWLLVSGAFGLAVVIALGSGVAVGWVLPSLPALPGRLEADPLTGMVSSLADVIGRLASTASLGLIAAVVAFVPPGTDGLGRAELIKWAGRCGQLWFAASALMTFANPAYVGGVPLGYLLAPGVWLSQFSTVPSSLAWLVSGFVAMAVVVVSYRAPKVSNYTLCWLAGAVATSFVVVTGNVSVGLDHDWATDAAGVAAIAGLFLSSGAIGVLAAAAIGVDPSAGLRQYQRAALPLLTIAALGYAVAAWQQLAGQGVLSTPAGAPILAGGLGFVAMLVNWGWRGRLTRPAGRLVSVAVDVVILVLGTAAMSAATHLPPPRFLVPQTIQVNYLGYQVDVPATIATLTGLGRPNLAWVLAVLVAIGGYGWGMARVIRAGGRWPIARACAWLAGWLLVLYLAASGLWVYSTAVFSWHMLLHMTVNMLVPVLCVLGAPLTLLDQAASRRPSTGLAGPRELLAGLSSARVVRFLLSPPVLWANYVGSLFLVYFTPLFGWLMRFHWAHQLMLAHFMVAGYLFFALLIGPDRNPWRLPYLVRFALLVSVMPFHAIFAVGIMMARTVIGETFYRMIAVDWVEDLLADQNTAGQITWFTGEIPAFIAVIALAFQWFSHDRAEAARADQAADSGEGELDAYNEMLAELAARNRAAGSTDGGLE